MIKQTTRSEVAAMNDGELEELVALIVNRRSIINSQAAMKLHVGQLVEWKPKQDSWVTITGTISKIKRGGRIECNPCSDGKIWSLVASHVKTV